MMKVRGFNHLTLSISNLQKSISFYCGILGMELIHKGRTDAYLEWGNAWICLLEKNNDKPNKPILGMDHIAFSIDEEDFQEAVNMLKKHNIPIVREPVERGGGLSLQFTDPDSIIFELFTGSLTKRMKNWK